MNEQKGEKAWALHTQVIKNEQMRRALLIENMKNIHELHLDKLYTVIIGDEDAPWSAYLANNDIFYSASQVYTYDKIYGKFVKELNIDIDKLIDIPHSKLSNLISVVTKENVDDWLSKAESLTTQDFEDELRKAKGKISYLDCPHKYVPYSICSSCGFRHKGEHTDDTKDVVESNLK